MERLAYGFEKRVTLESFEDKEHGITGLGIVGTLHNEGMNAASEGMLIAHDLLEHMNGVEAIGSIADELEALGAIWFVRGQWGDLDRNRHSYGRSVYENIAVDIDRMFRDHFYGESIPAIPPQSTDDDDNLRCILEASNPMGEIDDEDEETAREMLDSYLESALSRMQRGYAKACYMWQDLAPACAADLFWTIAEAVDPHAKSPDYPGMRFSLVYGIDKNGNAYAHCSEQWEDDDEDDEDDEENEAA